MERTGSVHERLLYTAARLFYAEGIRAVGIDRVIAESGVAKSTMYQHFRSKEELVAAYLREVSAGYRAQLEPAREASGNAVDRVLAVYDRMADVVAAPEFRGCPFGNAAAEYPNHDGVRAAVTEHRTWLHGFLANLLGSQADAATIGALLQLHDGVLVGAYLDHAEDATRTARRTAAALLDARAA